MQKSVAFLFATAGSLAMATAALTLVSCKGRHPTSAKIASDTQATAAAAPSEIPAEGRSLFDHLFRDGSTYRIPLVFGDLAAQLQQATNDPVVVAPIPTGRSLVRLKSERQFFASPRLVLAITNGTQTDNGDRGLSSYQGRIFIGYQREAKELEVISYNAAMGRYEFQLVENYGAGLVPRVVYVKRSFCMSCHTNGAAIFPAISWDETMLNDQVTRFLRIGLGDALTFEGVNLMQMHNKVFPAAPRSIDETSTLLSNQTVRTQILWKDACGKGTDGRSCRANLALGLLLPYKFNEELAPGQTLGSTLSATWLRNFGGEAFPRSAEIINRDPFSAHAPLAEAIERKRARGENFQKEWNDLMIKIEADLMRPAAAVDPLQRAGMEPFQARLPYNLLLEGSKAIGFERLYYEVGRALADRRARTGDSNTDAFPVLRAAIDQMQQGEDDLFAPKGLRPATFIASLVRTLGATPSAKLLADVALEESAPSGFPQAEEVATIGVAPELIRNPGLQPFIRFCYACHGNPSQGAEPLFLVGDTEDEILRKFTPELRGRIERQLTRSSMPPPGTEEAIELTPALRQALIRSVHDGFEGIPQG